MSSARVNLWDPSCVWWVMEATILDEAELRMFLAQSYARLVAGVTMIAGSRAAAEDAVQEALARAWERSDRGEHIESLPAWVTRVALNLAKSRLRRVRAETRARQRITHAAGPGSDGTDIRLDIERALAALPRRQREVTVLRYYLGLDVAETAATLEVSIGTVKTCLHRARRALAAALGETDPEETNDHAELR
jgi:RNA polymerase sigma-70 factor, ECF subfamily